MPASARRDGLEQKRPKSAAIRNPCCGKLWRFGGDWPDSIDRATLTGSAPTPCGTSELTLRPLCSTMNDSQPSRSILGGTMSEEGQIPVESQSTAGKWILLILAMLFVAATVFGYVTTQQ